MTWISSEDLDLPGIYGAHHLLDASSCESFRSAISAGGRRWGVAGLPNTGTNALWRMMTKNCDAPGLWQVPWGKHQFMNESREESVLPLVLVKDPLQWFASTCRKQYFDVHLNSVSCPSPLAHTWGSLKGTQFDNLFDLWVRWHAEYLRADTPRMMIRFEELLFAPKATISAACTCVGGTVREPFLVLESVPKWGPGHSNVTNRSETLLRFETKRSVEELVLTDADWELLTSTDKEQLMEHFHYPLATSGSSTMSLIGHPVDILSQPDWGDEE